MSIFKIIKKKKAKTYPNFWRVKWREFLILACYKLVVLEVERLDVEVVYLQDGIKYTYILQLRIFQHPAPSLIDRSDHATIWRNYAYIFFRDFWNRIPIIPRSDSTN